MITFLQILILIAVICCASLYRLSLIIWAPIMAIILGALTYLGTVSNIILVPLWAILLICVIFLGIPVIRRNILTKRTLNFFQRALPPMSVTEKVAIEAGDVWWEGELFCGEPNWHKLHAYHKPTLTDAEQAFIDNQVETLCTMIDDWKVVHEDHDLPPAVWNYIKKERFWGIVIKPEYGGLGFSSLAHSTIVMKIASRNVAAAITVMVPNSLGPGELIYRYGTDEQKKYYMPRLAAGEEIPCFGLTGTEIGSDAGAMPDKGIVCKGEFNGKEIIGIKLNFDKRYITLAPVATILGIAFKLYDPDHLLGKTTNLGITLCLIPNKHPGVTVGDRHIPMNMPFMNGPVKGKDVFIPLDWIIGGADMAGQGWRMLMECLSIGRGISLPALATASAKVSYLTTGAYSRIRKQFKLPIGNLEGVAEAMARIAGYTYMIEATRVFTTTAIDQHIKPAIASAIAKYHMTEMGRKIVNDALDVHAGRGVQLGPRNYLGNIFQAQPLSITVEGANILTRCLIIFGQGAIRCHPYIRLEMEAAANPDKKQGLNQFDVLLKRHIGYAASNTLRAFIYGLTDGTFIRTHLKKHPLANFYRQLTRMSTALAVLSDMAMLLLGGNLKRKETLSGRLGDILSNLYMASAVLKYFEDRQQSASDLPYVRWALKTCLYQSQTAIESFLANFPHRFTAFLLKKIIFPFGRSYRPPKDKLSQRLSHEMMSPNEMRKHIGQNCFVGNTAKDPIFRVENALHKWAEIEPYDKRITTAIREGKIKATDNFAELIKTALSAGILAAPEAQLLSDYNEARFDAIMVDSFPAEYFER